MAISGGKYAAEVLAGRVFIISTAAAGVAIPISTGTAVTFGVWNTAPGKFAIPLWINIGFTSGTIALGEFGLANQDCGYGIATAAALSAFQDATLGTNLKNALIGSGNAPAMRYCPSGTTTLTTGGTAAMWFGASHESATPVGGVNNLHYDFDGSVMARPGQLLFACGSVAQTGIFTMSMAVAEVDIP